MKLIVAGGRDYKFGESDMRKLDRIDAEEGIEEIVSGGASGADEGGEEWAAMMGVPVKRFPADWNKHGRAAGPIRNRQMAEYADAVALFPGGRGTESMHAEATRAGIRIYDFRDGPENSRSGRVTRRPPAR